MSIREALVDVIKNTIASIKIVKIVGTATQTRVQGVDEGKTIHLDATLNGVIPEFEGEFGIGNIALLKGLLAFPTYKADKATITAKRRPWQNGQTTVETIAFRDEYGVGTDFRCMSPERVPPQADIKTMKWIIEFQLTAAKFAEFSQLASLFGGSDIKETLFGIKFDKNCMLATFGTDHALTHRANMILTDNVNVNFTREPLWGHAEFIALVKLAGGQDVTVRFSEQGVLSVDITTPVGVFKYYLRPQTRE